MKEKEIGGLPTVESRQSIICYIKDDVESIGEVENHKWGLYGDEIHHEGEGNMKRKEEDGF